MKTHELISLAEYVSKIMAHYPNKSVEYALDDILNILETRNNKPHSTYKAEQRSQTQTQTQKKSKNSKVLRDNTTLGYVSGEIENSDDESNKALSKLPLDELKKIASGIGIRTSSRQNKAILVMNISKTMERRRIDSTIKDKDKEE